jgi:hypothetical protein
MLRRAPVLLLVVIVLLASACGGSPDPPPGTIQVAKRYLNRILVFLKSEDADVTLSSLCAGIDLHDGDIGGAVGEFAPLGSPAQVRGAMTDLQGLFEDPDLGSATKTAVCS